MSLNRPTLAWMLPALADTSGLPDSIRLVMREAGALLAEPDPAAAEREAIAGMVRRWPGLTQQQADAIEAAIKARSQA